MGKKYGTRQEVFDGLSQMTRGGLSKDDLMISRGKIVSKKKSAAAKESYAKYGFKKREVPEPEVKPKRRRRKKVTIKENVTA